MVSDLPESRGDSQGENPGPEELARRAGQLLQLATQCRDDVIQARLRALGLTSARWRVIAIVGQFASCTMGELAFVSGIDRTTLTRMADQLARQAFVVRATPSNDRRKVTLSLTPKGQRVFRRGLAAIEEVNRQVFSGVADAKLEATIDVLKQVIGAAAPGPRELEMMLSLSSTREPSGGD